RRVGIEHGVVAHLLEARQADVTARTIRGRNAARETHDVHSGLGVAFRSGRDLAFRRVRIGVTFDGARSVEMRRIDLGPAVAGGGAEQRGAADVANRARALPGCDTVRDLDDLPLAVAEHEEI